MWCLFVFKPLFIFYLTAVMYAISDCFITAPDCTVDKSHEYLLCWIGVWGLIFTIWFQYVFSCDQAALRTLLFVRPSVRLSVCPFVTPFSLCSYPPIIPEFSGVITNDRCDVHAKGQGQRSKVKVTEVMTQISRFRTVTPVWIHIWR